MAAVLPAWYALFHLGRLEKGGRVLVLGTEALKKYEPEVIWGDWKDIY